VNDVRQENAVKKQEKKQEDALKRAQNLQKYGYLALEDEEETKNIEEQKLEVCKFKYVKGKFT
jgi:hypothetical protein